jgi:hypothetical protein
MFIHNEKTRQKFTIKERMLLEVAKSIEIAYELWQPLYHLLMWRWKYMPTINTNPHFKSNDALERSDGIHIGNGLLLSKAKPEAFASSQLC